MSESASSVRATLLGDISLIRADIELLSDRLEALVARVDCLQERLNDLDEDSSYTVVRPSFTSRGYRPAEDTGSLVRSPAEASAGPGLSWAEREAISADIGRYLRRALNGEHRGSSGRARLPQGSRYYIVCRTVSGAVHTNPVLILTQFSEVERLCDQGRGDWGDSVFVGLPSKREVLDVFYYPDMARDWVRCPPHVDPGLVTLVVADHEGLEAQDSNKLWLPLGTGAVALVGAEWALAADWPKCQPCIHRVKIEKSTCRVSLALEFRLNSHSRQRLSHRMPQSERSLGMKNVEAAFDQRNPWVSSRLATEKKGQGQRNRGNRTDLQSSHFEAMDVLQMIFGIIVIVLMLGLGAAMSLKDFKVAVRMWKAPLVAVMCQFILMPLISFGLAMALGVTKEQGLSMLVVGCSPGGSTSNLFAYYSKADLPLSILATSLSTLLSVALMPLCMFIYSGPFTDENVAIPLTSLITPLSLARPLGWDFVTALDLLLPGLSYRSLRSLGFGLGMFGMREMKYVNQSLYREVRRSNGSVG
eukprot:Skav235535  [mRNA]  locus=scaffold3067:98175:109526:+ [translate_table: standard]